MATARELYGLKWTEKEYLIVLHYYLEHRGEAQHADTPFVQDISRLLGRTPHSILYRLQNYASIDPEEKDPRRKGKIHITDFGWRLFNKWSKKPSSLRDIVELLLRDERAKLEPDRFNPCPVRVPITFKNYELLDEIGRGGFGVVISCLNTKTEETYAIKVIDGARLSDAECLHRFRREIRALKAIEHPHVIRIYEDNLDTEEDYPGYVMDLAECDLPVYLGRRAKDHGRDKKRPILQVDEATRILIAIMNATQCLHESDPPIIHRDINPNNILRLFDGTWVLADFSLAKFCQPTPVSTSFVTETHVGMGTSHYTSPEQYQDLRSTDARSDIHALGWLIRDLYSFETPYPRRNPSGLLPELEEVFLRATEYNREDRYETVAKMKNATEIALNEIKARDF